MVTDNRSSDTLRRKARPRRLAALLVMGLLLVAFAGGGLYLAYTGRDRPPTPEELPSFEPPGLTQTGFLNTGPEAKYVGNEACAECHAAEFQSYKLTAHSQALSPLDPSAEPADAEFKHATSQRDYRIYRDGDEFRQRELLADEQGVIAEQDYAMDWLIGSGRHSRSYLVEIDGFLVESPVTWYSSRKSWDVSPGYDNPHHWGFERAADEGCLFCHVGHVEPEGDALSRLTIRQQAISCERCHGPGSLHVERRRSGEAIRSEQGDPTIVHPGRMDRKLGEAICAQCHLRGDATVTVRGRRITDYRPGLPLTDVRIDYQLNVDNRPMKVVGHVEQLRLSRCWQVDQSLTCTTCHDPHRDAPPEDKIAFYREKCLQCHAPEACGLPVDTPRRVETGDNCNQCHMPQVETDIPHIAFTHHRIGIHSEEIMPPVDPREAELVPTASVDHLPEIDRDRCLGLAYLEYSEKQASPDAAREFRRRAWQLLTAVHDQGLFDGDTEAALARIMWEEEPSQAVPPAQAALHAPTLSPQSRINALFILADAAYRSGEYETAVESLQQLITLRRHSEDHFLLAVCQAQLDLTDTALEHAEKAIEIHPFRPEFYELAAHLSKSTGQEEKAARYQDAFERMRDLQQQETPVPSGGG